MGRRAREERQEKREDYAAKISKNKRKTTLMATGILALIAVIVGYSGYVFITMDSNVPGAPDGAGRLGDEHVHASLLVRLFGDKFDFAVPSYQIKSSWIHFEDSDGTTIHRHSSGVMLGYLFDTLNIGIDSECYIFPDGRQFCTNEDYSLKYFINHQPVKDINDYV
ncbi:MAG: protein-disulfide isomerase, partial [Thermoproteota archaeon]|nr:protein-disulfide isomerase [Thermoproteota archaeon]